jgi:hypothetical protein
MKLRFCTTLSVLILIISISAEAQKSHSIVRVGVNFASVTRQPNGRFETVNMLTAVQFGFSADIHLGSFAYLQPGIIYTGKGSKVKNGDPSGATYYKATSDPYYIEVPLNLVLKTPGKYRFFVGAGPYVAVGISGKNKVDGKLLNTNFHSEQNIKFSDEDPAISLDYKQSAGLAIMKRFDYGFNGTAGLEYKRFILAGNFGYGLAQLQENSSGSSDNVNKHRVISVILGFRF